MLFVLPYIVGLGDFFHSFSTIFCEVNASHKIRQQNSNRLETVNRCFCSVWTWTKQRKQSSHNTGLTCSRKCTGTLCFPHATPAGSEGKHMQGGVHPLRILKACVSVPLKLPFKSYSKPQKQKRTSIDKTILESDWGYSCFSWYKKQTA